MDWAMNFPSIFYRSNSFKRQIPNSSLFSRALSCKPALQLVAFQEGIPALKDQAGTEVLSRINDMLYRCEPARGRCLLGQLYLQGTEASSPELAMHDGKQPGMAVGVVFLALGASYGGPVPLPAN